MTGPTFASILRWATRTFGEDVTERVFAPLVADWARDVDEPSTTPAQARAHLRWAAAFVRTSTEVSAACMARGATTVAPAMSGTLIAFTVAGTALVTLPTVVQWARHDFFSWRMLATLIPSSVVLALASAVLPAAAMLAAAHTHDARSGRHGLAAVTVVLSAVLFLGTGWAVPTANRSWQHAAAARVGRAVPPPGLRELSLVQLVAAAPSAPTDAVRREIRGRVLIPMLWPAAMAFLGWRLGRRMKSPSLTRAFVAWLVGAATIAVFAVAPLAGLVFEDVDVICASLWLAGGLALRPRGVMGGARDATSC